MVRKEESSYIQARNRPNECGYKTGREKQSITKQYYWRLFTKRETRARNRGSEKKKRVIDAGGERSDAAGFLQTERDCGGTQERWK